MLIDAQTLDDLEVFRAEDGNPSLFESLNRAVTKGGREALRRRFRAPLSEPRQIIAVQDALRFVTAHRELFRTLPNEQNVAPVQRYLESNYVTLDGLNGPGAVFKSLWILLNERGLFLDALTGVQCTARLVAALAEFTNLLDQSRPPAVLADQLTDMRLILADPDIGALQRHPVTRGTSARVLRLDHLIRYRFRQRFQRLLEAVHEVDALVGMADVTAERGFAYPEFESGGAAVRAEGVYHPFLATPVPNALQLDEAGSVLFLTGPNMAGKTTYLRACGVAVFLAHLGMGVPAKWMRLTPFDCLFTGIRTTDNLREGVSYFLAEARRVKAIAELLARGVRAFVVFDEVFKGTNVKDAFDACRRVLLGFANATSGVFLVSSHLVELVEDLKSSPRIGFSYFGAEVDDDMPRFDYRLQAGHSSQRLGMTVLEREGVFKLLDAIKDHRHDSDGTAHVG